MLKNINILIFTFFYLCYLASATILSNCHGVTIVTNADKNILSIRNFQGDFIPWDQVTLKIQLTFLKKDLVREKLSEKYLAKFYDQITLEQLYPLYYI